MHGRFRSYLLGALKHFLANCRRDAGREKRGGGAEHVVWQSGTDTSPGVDIAENSSRRCEAEFDRAWALALVERALQLLEAECAARGRAAQLSSLRPLLTPNASAASQTEAAAELGLSDGAMRVAIHRLRRRFREIVRAEIAQTLDAPGDIEEEMRHLVAALSG
jgi:RNA polymerase sigma-70 factor (ECF subfamily)